MKYFFVFAICLFSAQCFAGDVSRKEDPNFMYGEFSFTDVCYTLVNCEGTNWISNSAEACRTEGGVSFSTGGICLAL